MTEYKFTAGTNLRSFLLIEKLDSDYLGEIWKAQHSHTRASVRVKILHPVLTADPQIRKQFLDEALVACQLDHLLVSPVVEAIEIDGLVVIASEPFEGQPLQDLINGHPLADALMVRLAEGMSEALASAHDQGVVHGNLRVNDVVIGEDSALRLSGFGTGRRSDLSAEARNFLQEPRHALYLAPEKLFGEPIDHRTDIFAVGVLLYQMATGVVPFSGASADEVCENVVSQSPPNPRLHNPKLDVTRIRIIGKCLQKDPAKRYQSLRVLIQDLAALNQKRPELMTFSGLASFSEDIPLPPPMPVPMPDAAASATPSTPARPSPALESTLIGDDTALAPAGVILFASLPEPTQGDGKLSGVMQQILGEAAYMFDGRIVDPFGTKLVAQFSDPLRAINAARKGRDELQAYNRRQRDVALQVPARMVLHGGEVSLVRGAATGAAVSVAETASQRIQPLTIVASPAVLDQARLLPSGDPLTSVEGVPFYALPAHPVIPLESPSVPSDPSVAQQQTPAEKKTKLAVIAAVAGAILLMLASIAWYVSRLDRHLDVEEARSRAAEPPKPPPVAASAVREVTIEAFSFDAGNPSLQASADHIRFGSIGLLAIARPLLVHGSAAGQRAERFSARLIAPANAAAMATSTLQAPSPGAAPATVVSTSQPAHVVPGAGVTQLVPIRYVNGQPVEGPPFAFATSEDAAANFTRWIRQQLGLETPPAPVTSATVFDEFAEAIRVRESGTDPTPALGPIRQAVKSDPDYLPAQLAAVDLLAGAGDRKAAIDSATRVVALDPGNIDVRRKLAGWKAQSGTPAEALSLFASVLAARPDDIEALQAVALYALAVDDEARFTKALARLQPLLREAPRFHAPDLLLATGQIDKSATPLFEIENDQKENGALALKIGRVAVLRRMMTIAELEQKKLDRLDPGYGKPLLAAYIAAQNGDRTEAEAQLKKAQAGASWKNVPYTYSAEVYALLDSQKGVIDSLQAAVAHGEPSGSYILHNPLFRYLANDSRYRKIQAEILRQQDEIRAQLARISM
ncbi:MAG: protein kinase [Acidobacteriota bacterium]